MRVGESKREPKESPSKVKAKEENGQGTCPGVDRKRKQKRAHPKKKQKRKMGKVPALHKRNTLR